MATSETSESTGEATPERGVEKSRKGGFNVARLAAAPGAWLAQTRHFWHEIGLEMKKVSWPARTEVVNTTIIVVIAVFFFAAYLFVADILFTYLIEGIEWGAGKLFG